MRNHQVLLALLTCLLFGSGADAQLKPATAPSPLASGSNLLGERFQSEASGIALRPPAGSKAVRGTLGGPDIASFVHEDRKWVVKLTRVLLDEGKPLPLTLWKDPNGIERAGMFEWTIEQFKTDRPGAQIIRQEATKINGTSVGLMSAKFSFGLETDLIQEAVIRASDMQYYLVSLTCPAPRTDKAEELAADPTVQLASETFNQMLDSVELLDQTSIRRDQEDRLLHTRTLFVNIKSGEKLKKVLEPEQWLRFMRDGKDVGYSVVYEEVAHDLPYKGRVEVQTGPEGVLIGVRSRMMPEAGIQTDGESWLFCTYDSHYEAFYSIAYLQDPKTGKKTTGEVGSSHWREKPVPDVARDIGQKRGVSLTEEYRLEVTKLGPNLSNEPIRRDLPPYYLPMALGQLLPRLAASFGPQKYLFATWVSDAGQVMYRYVDVEADRDVILGNRHVRAIPVKDRVGLEGSVTTHYVGPNGKYLGSSNDDSKFLILATDAPTIEKIWANADLTRPNAAEGK